MKYKTHVLSLICAGALVCPSASGYYHFVRFLSRTGPFVPITEKFDLNALPNRAINFYISEQGPSTFAPNDSLPSVVSQIRNAARVWSEVPTSDIHLNFGGTIPAGTASSGTAIDIVFSDDIPPGLIALGGPTSRGDVTGPPLSAAFVPINHAVVVLRRNLADTPSSSEQFALTVTHEMGHALGLQHTLASSVMSTSITRGTTKAKPLASDDIAAISLLYPTRGFQSAVGSISGRVTLAGTGVNLASVVAIPPTGTAVSTLTNPDGTYRIEGIPPGQYFVYVHPLPPAGVDESSPANIVLPLGPDGRPFPVGANFDTQFFPGTKDPSTPIGVTAGNSVDGVNFQVQRRNTPSIWAVQTYSFIGQLTVRPAILNRSNGNGTIVAYGVGLMSGQNSLTAGLSAVPIGGAAGLATGSLKPYQYAPAFVQMDLAFNPFTADGSHHLIFSAQNDIYVLPSAFHVTQKGPPAVNSATSTVDTTGARAVALTGTNFASDTRFFFDGHTAAVRSIDEASGRAIVIPPPASPGYRATVVAFNSDGQSSNFAQGNALTSYTYDGVDTAPLSVSPGLLSAGSEAMIEVNAPGSNFVDGLANIGFGSADIQVRRVWVISPTRLIANIAIAPTATPGPFSVTIVNGLQYSAQASSFVVLPSNPRQVSVFPQVTNPLTGQSIVQAGGAAMVLVSNLAAANPAAVSLTLNDIVIPVTGVNGSQVTFQIPANFPAGPAILRIRTATDAAQPIVIAIEPPPPQILAIQNSGAPVDVNRPAQRGDLLTLVVGGLVADAFTGSVSTQRLTVSVGGVEHTVQNVFASAIPGQFFVQFALSFSVQSGTQFMTLSQDSRVSTSASLPVR